MPLSQQAQDAIPEIAAWLEEEATRRKGRTVPDGLCASAAILRYETARLTLDDTAALFDAASTERWGWGTYSAPTYQDSEAPGAQPVNWSRLVTEASSSLQFEVTHESLVGAMRKICADAMKATRLGNGLDLDDVRLIEDVLTAKDRAELNAALAEIYPALCVVLVQFAAFGEHRYPLPSLT